MKIYTYSQARQKLANILEESKSEEVVIWRRSGDTFSIIPKKSRRRSPFDVPGLRKKINRKDILEAIRESRDRR
jgi:prevent-host-death family protein